MIRSTWGALLCVVAVSCGAQNEPDPAVTGPGIGSGSPQTTASPPGDEPEGDDDGGEGDTGGGADDGDSSGDDGVGSGGPRFDLGTDIPGVEPPEEGCTKVDFLFVIDSSPSMEDQQAALIASFPAFMSTISTTLNAESDYHIMVADTDAEDRCTPSTCPVDYCSDDDDYACTADFDACDVTMGAGVVHPSGNDSSNTECNPFGGQRYIIESEPDLTGTFSCMAQVGTAGIAQERPMDALVEAVSASMNMAGSCNQGFLRDDAILVITFISDDPHYEDTGTPMDWYNAVVTAKNGDPSAVVVLGLTPAWDGCGNQDIEDRGAHWVEFIELFGDHGLHGSVCEADYSPFFQDAVDIIDQTCDEFMPPG